MRYWYVNRNREKVFQGSSLLVLAGLAIIILFAIQPREGTFRETLSSLEADAVALNYARVLVALSPEDAELKALLAQQYANLGRLAEADAVLIGLTGRHPDVRYTLLHLDVLRQRLYASTNQRQRGALTSRVINLLQGLPIQALAHADRQSVAEAALAFGQPFIAAQIYQGLFVATRNPEWGLHAGTQYEAAGRPDLAATAYARASTVPGDHVNRAVEQALRLYLAAGDHAAGIAFLGDIETAGMTTQARQSAVYFALSAHAPALAGQYASLLAEEDAAQDLQLSNVTFADLISAALGINDLDTARHWALRAQRNDPTNPQLRRQLAEVLEWRGDISDALEHWRWLADHAPGYAQSERTWQLARSTYRNDLVADILSARAKRSRLSTDEINSWLQALVSQSALDKTITELREYVSRFPDDEHAWRAGARLLADNEDLHGALDWWAQVDARFAVSATDLQEIAALHWRLFDLPSALATLQRVNPDTVTYDAPYWRDVGDLAHRTGNRQLANDAYLRLAAFDTLSADEYDVLFDTMTAQSNSDYRYHANQAWEQTGAPRFLLKAMEAEFEADASRFERLLAAADDHFDALRTNPLYWTLKGRHQVRALNPDGAARSFDAALALAPNYVPAVSAYAWLLLEQRSLTRLWQLLDSRPNLALEHAELYAPFAEGYMALARYDEAAFWYRKAIHHDPNDTYLALAFTGALMKTGRVDEALHWRRDTLKRALAQLPDIEGLDISALRTLSAGMLTRADFERLMYGLRDGNAAPFVRTLINDHLDAQNLDAARFWVAYAQQHDIPLDDYPLFMVAHQARDLHALAPYREHVRPTMRTEALLASNEDSRALLAALEQINTRTPQNDRLMLTRIAADITIDRPSGVQLHGEHRDFGTVTASDQALKIARTFDDYHVAAAFTSTDYQFDEALVEADAPDRVTERSASIRVGSQFDRGRWEVEAGVAHSPAGDRTPVSVTGQWQWNQRHTSLARLSFDQRPDESPLLQAFGSKSALLIGHSFRPTARDSISAQVAAEQFNDRAGDKLSHGYRAELGWQHNVFFERPAVVARAAMSSARRSAPTITRSLAEQIAALAQPDLLPERTDRVGIGITIANGEPGRMNWRVPTPRYRLDVDVGYQWPDKQPTYEISASVGTRVFGDDELALRLSYASRPDLGPQASGFAAGLTYNYRLGR